MQKFDPNKDLSLSMTFFVVLCALTLVCIWFWLSQKPYDYDGARAMATDNNGVTHIHVGNKLYRFDAAGRVLPEINLTELGVIDFVGNLTFNDKNELLLRQARDTTSFFQNLSILLRVSNKRNLESHEAESLLRCNLALMECEYFGDSVHEFNRGFFSAYDAEDGSILISDASSHQLLKFNYAGHKIAELTDDLNYPNDLMIESGYLFLVDTYNKAIKKISIINSDFGSVLNSYSVANPNAQGKNFFWPYTVEKSDQGWWAIILDDNMDKGGVFLFDNNWNYVKALKLGKDATPISMLKLGNQMLLSDIEAQNVARYTTAGEFLGLVNHPELNRHLMSLAEKRQIYRSINILFLVLVSMGMIMLFGYLLLAYVRQSRELLVENLASEPVTDLDIARAVKY